MTQSSGPDLDDADPSKALSGRLLTLGRVFNARDVGGYRTPAGPIAWRRLLRTAGLDGLDDKGRAQLAELGLRTVVDLRRDEERLAWPNALGDHLWAHAAMTVIAMFSCFPVYWMFVTALRPTGREYDQSPLPFPPSLDSLRYVFDTLPVWRLLGNTLFFATTVTFAQLLTCLLAAYAFTAGISSASRSSSPLSSPRGSCRSR